MPAIGHVKAGHKLATPVALIHAFKDGPPVMISISFARFSIFANPLPRPFVEYNITFQFVQYDQLLGLLDIINLRHAC